MYNIIGMPSKKSAKMMKKIMKKNKGLKKHGKGHLKKPVLAYRMTHNPIFGGPKLHEGLRHKPRHEQWRSHRDIPNHGRKCSPKHGNGPIHGHGHGHGFGQKHRHDHHFSHGQKNSHGFRSEYRNLQPLIIDLCVEDGIDMTFEVHPKTSETQGQTTTNPTTSGPATSAAATVNSPATPAPSARPVSFATPPQSSSSVNEPVVTPPEPSLSGHVRRNSDDWTLLNRESPHRNDDVAMDIDNASARSPHHVYPELPKDSASAPPPQQDAALERERQNIQEAVERIRSMGFDFETSVLQDLLRTQNCNIASVLEMILSNAAKK